MCVIVKKSHGSRGLEACTKTLGCVSFQTHLTGVPSGQICSLTENVRLKLKIIYLSCVVECELGCSCVIIDLLNCKKQQQQQAVFTNSSRFVGKKCGQ